MADEFTKGAELALQVYGIKQQKERQALLSKLYQAQIQNYNAKASATEYEAGRAQAFRDYYNSLDPNAPDFAVKGARGLMMQYPEKAAPYIDDLIAASPEGHKRALELKAAGKAPKTPTPQQALDKIFQIKKSLASLDKTDKVDQLMISMFPDKAGLIGQKMNPKQKQEIIDAANNAIKYYERFAPKIIGTGKEKGTNKKVNKYSDGTIDYAD
jgi:hypothetical protein